MTERFQLAPSALHAGRKAIMNLVAAEKIFSPGSMHFPGGNAHRALFSVEPVPNRETEFPGFSSFILDPVPASVLQSLEELFLPSPRRRTSFS